VSPTLESGEQPLFTIILAIDTNEEPTQLLSKMSFTVTIIVIVIVIVLLLIIIIIMRPMISPYL
jgi:flagellar biosynthesis/type III secretory pathway M-ring protein FliF/YscJ